MSLKNYHDKRRSGLSNYMLLYYYKLILYQCNWYDREVDTLLEYINELEFRLIKYRL